MRGLGKERGFDLSVTRFAYFGIGDAAGESAEEAAGESADGVATGEAGTG